MQIELGKRYWRRDGGVSGFICKKGDHAYSHHDGVLSWSEKGLWSVDESKFDLVREYIDPQPLEWKRGIPTEEECRECWIVTGGGREVPKSDGLVFSPGEVHDAEQTCFKNHWYLALRVKPVEPPKPKTATFRKYIEPNGTGEFQMLRDDLDHKSSGWTRTDETMEMEVPA